MSDLTKTAPQMRADGHPPADGVCGGLLEKNLSIVRDRFPTAAAALADLPAAGHGVEVRDSADGPVVFVSG